MSNLFEHLGNIDHDHKQLQQIDELQQAFNKVKKGYEKDYILKLKGAIDEVKSRLKNNCGMHKAVEIYIQKYVIGTEEFKNNAREELYEILAAEMLQTFQTLSHTSCSIM